MANILPGGFVYLYDIDNTILTDIRYASSNNFLGRPVAGYLVICESKVSKATSYFNSVTPFI